MLQNSVMNERKIDFTLQKPFDSILSANTLTTWLPSPRLARPERLSLVIKAFQNPVWAEQARNRLNQIKILTHAAAI